MTNIGQSPITHDSSGSGKDRGDGNQKIAVKPLIRYCSVYGRKSQVNSTNAETFQTGPQVQIKTNIPILPYSFPNISHSLTSKISRDEFIVAALPAYNEEKYIAKTIIDTKKYVDLVIVIDDGSSDSTAEIAAALGAMVIRHSGNKGYGKTLKTIFEKVRELEADKLVILDSDGQHDPRFIPELLKPLDEGIDIVIGSRFLPEMKNNIPTYRIFGIKILNIATNVLGNVNVSDSQSGFRAYGKRAINLINVHKSGMGAGSEILLQTNENQLKLTEVPINVRYDLDKKSSQNAVRHGISVLINIISYISLRRPLVIFGGSGLLLVFIGIIIEIYIFSDATGPFNYILFAIGLTSLNIGLFIVISGLILYSLVQILISRKEDSSN